MSGSFVPGERVNIRMLAAALGTSPTPVREALSRLAAEGAVEIVPGRSVRIPSFDPELYRELIAIRRALEGLAAERATGRITPQEIEKLEQLFNEYVRAARANRTAQSLSLSREFRFAVYAAARMPELLSMIERLWTRTAPSLKLMYHDEIADPELELAYSDLVEALKGRDKKSARSAVESAIGIALKRLHLADADMPSFKAEPSEAGPSEAR